MADHVLANLLDDVKMLLLYGSYRASTTKELENLEEMLGLLNAFLRDMARIKRAKQLTELDLERRIKEVAYETRDAIEYWLIQKEAAKARNIFARVFMSSGSDYALGSAINITSKRWASIVSKYRISIADITETNQAPSEQQNREGPGPAIAPKNYVGFEDEAESLISSLMEETEELGVIAVTGMPGIGKTTLASKIYHDYRIQHEFPTRIWLDVSSCKDSCVDILKQFMLGSQELMASPDIAQEACSKDSCLDDDRLRGAVSDYLQPNRYLLVMDGVWDADSLNQVIHMLPKMGGKVLITSRNNDITAKPHVLKFLNEKESWDLLQLEVFGGKLDECPDTLKSLGERIAKKCDGSPLAIVTVASSLVVESSTEEAEDRTNKLWTAVSEDVITCITDYGQSRLFTSLESSYLDLPQHLRTYFLYLGVFPQGHEIPVERLTRLWIAEQLVRYDTKLDLEEKAKKYLEDLISRNLVMVGKTYPNGQISTCRLHILIHGFCKSKAAEQDFYQDIRMSSDRPISLAPTCRRLCVYAPLSEFLSGTPKGHVSSILCLNDENEVALNSKDISTIHKCFKLLKVLECKYVKFAKFPANFSKLMNLRYISLSCDDIDVIPETISSLRYLETLVVDTQSPSLQLKANIWRMFRLQHLVTKAAIVLAIRGKGEACKTIKTLTRLAPACCTEDVLKKTPNLNTLGIRGHLAGLPSAESLRKLERLENLKLINEPAADCEMHLDCFPPNLKRLTLSGTYLGWECMSILGKIDSLEILKLKNNAFVGESWTSTEADGFGCLAFLLIATTDLVSWEASPHCFPSLKCLVLKNCDKLHELPLAVRKASTLRM